MKPTLTRHVLQWILAAFALVIGADVFAQAGDREGEVQAPPPAHLKSPPSPALPVRDALATFRLPPGFRMEVVAAEPLVFDPVAMSIGPDGRIWVVEMRAFMPNADGKGEDAPIGSIAVLEDTNGDGRMDRRVEFAGGLVMPRALSLVADGVLVAEPPNLWFFEDTDGDGKADKRTSVASDYGDRTNPEHTANGLLWGMDNWIYSANHTVRFRYARGEWRREPTIFRGQWGIAQDDAGRLFYNNNSEPLRMDVLPAEYLSRNPHLVAPAGVNVQLARAQDVPVWPGRITLGVNRGYRILREDGTLPVLTAACGPVIYRGSTFPREFHGDAFIAEPSANLVKRLKVASTAGAFSASNAYDKSEFLTSTDERFRPVNLYNGPGGALYVVDMYRGIIQHRIYLTTYLRNQIQQRGLEAPVGLGRIYRIVADGSPRYRTPNLARADTKRLVAALAHREAWWRETAQRLLVEKQELAAVPALRALVLESSSELARLHALWTLDGLDAADERLLEKAIADVDVEVAAAATRIAGKFLRKAEADVMRALRERIGSGEPAFLRQAALTLGEGPAATVDPVLERMAVEHGALPYLADAIVSSLAGRESAMLDRLATRQTPGSLAVIASLAAVVLKSGDAATIDRLLARFNAKESPPGLLDALLDGVDRFIPGDGSRQRKVMLPREPRALIGFARSDAPAAARATRLLPYLGWQGEPSAAAPAANALTPAENQRFDRGRSAYAVCAACHQPQGEGLAGLAPSLVTSPWVSGDPRALIRIVLQGKTSGQVTMPPLGALDDETIADILTFVRRSWGHAASAVDPAQVRAARTETRGREDPWNEAELSALK